ncbi:hypothetical protein RHGRI_006250 [Rhododendron griersonianum]|uniref:KIB1-4 beta-propeller domain-containing protein n=1 Tax=Rhododendron griersonianum TaxID=479676 RepID=A0AAV6KU41_9ERIC|nr:hypothetical protein RHGRI_006250 [Rhododendron griersonianum]
MFPGTITTAAATDGTTVTTNGDSLTRRFVSFPVGKNILANPSEHDFPLLPVPHQSLCRGSHKGWLVMVDKDMSMYLQNPFTGRRIDLPPVTSLPRADSSWASMSKWYIEKVIMSASPSSSSSSSSSSDCFVVVFFGPGDQVAFCKVGDKNWRLLKNPESSGYYIDGIYYKEQFHIVDEYGKIYVSDPLDSPDQPKLNEFYPQNRHSIDYVQKWYLVECGGELYQILRKIKNLGDTSHESDDDEEDIGDQGEQIDIGEEEGDHINDDSDDDEGEERKSDDDDDEREERKSNTYEFDDFDYDNIYESEVRNFIKRTTRFHIFKLETSGSEPKWICTAKDFNGAAVFLGYNQSFALSKSDLMSYKGDRIYYTDDDIASHQLCVRSGQDMGIFSLRDSKFEPLCSTNSESTKPPAVWITPCDGGSN